MAGYSPNNQAGSYKTYAGISATPEKLSILLYTKKTIL